MSTGHWIKSDQRKVEARVWADWLGRVAAIRDEFADFIPYDPMSNEVASMGVLSVAAARSGLLSSTEFICRKRTSDDRRRHGGGRGDLWLADRNSGQVWAIEAKQWDCRPGTRINTLVKALESAADDAHRVDRGEASRFYGLLVARFPDEGHADTRLHELMEELSEQADFVWVSNGKARPVYFFFASEARKPKLKP